ncbi:hypothetical protein RB195_020254 [Necator americanus]|uniref:Uncharacterized protein n=1 Tax=Necator americanus TaxID=51031 RepID=A0ABR1CJT1_NECAM
MGRRRRCQLPRHKVEAGGYFDGTDTLARRKACFVGAAKAACSARRLLVAARSSPLAASFFVPLVSCCSVVGAHIEYIKESPKNSHNFPRSPRVTNSQVRFSDDPLESDDMSNLNDDSANLLPLSYTHLLISPVKLDKCSKLMNPFGKHKIRHEDQMTHIQLLITHNSSPLSSSSTKEKALLSDLMYTGISRTRILFLKLH